MVELIVIHIPKTAGISFLHTLQEVYGKENCQQVWDLFPYELHHHGDYTHRVDSPFYQDRAGFMRLVREVFGRPIEAKVLHGHMPMWVYDGFFPHVPRVVWFRNPTNQILSRIFHFRKHKILSAHAKLPADMAEHPLFRNNQFWYTGGSVPSLSGVVERYEEDLAKISDLLGWGSVTPYHYHPTEWEDGLRNELAGNEAFVSRLREINVHDYALYDYVR